MTQDRSRHDGNRPFFRKGISVTNIQFAELFFFLGGSVGHGNLRASALRAPTLRFPARKGKTAWTDFIGTTPLRL